MPCQSPVLRNGTTDTVVEVDVTVTDWIEVKVDKVLVAVAHI